MKRVTLVLLFCGLSMGCNKGGTQVSKAKEDIEYAQKQSTQEEHLDPCSFVSEAEMRRICSIESTLELKLSTLAVLPNSCRYEWRKSNADELEKAQGKAITKRFRERMRKMVKPQGSSDRGMEAPEGLEPPTGMVSVTVPPFAVKDAQAVLRAFEQSKESLAKGVSSTMDTRLDEAQELAVQVDDEAVEGIGDAAIWRDQKNQLAVLKEKKVVYFDVRVTATRQGNKELAKELAKSAISKL